MKRVIYLAVPIAGAIALVALLAVLAHQSTTGVLYPSGAIASEQKRLLLFTLSLSALIVVPVFTLLTVFAVRYRAANTKARYEPNWGENKWLEGLWWGIPIFIIGILSIVTFQTSHSLDPHKPLAGTEPLEVQVVALRWKWLFIYPEQHIATLNQLPLPIDRPVTFSLTADAPMSSFWIPELGSQVYAMNTMSSELHLKATKLGTFTGYTTNINGEGYAKMTFKTKVLTRTAFEEWARTAANSNDSLTKATYLTLSKPASVQSIRTYGSVDSTLYDWILETNTHVIKAGSSAS